MFAAPVATRTTSAVPAPATALPSSATRVEQRERETARARPYPVVGWDFGTVRLQAKLEVGALDDALEQEADSVAESVMRAPDGEADVCCASCADGGEREDLQRAPAGSATAASGAAPAAVNQVLRSSGQPLDLAARAFFEPRFGHVFGDVRVHADAAADRSAHDVKARAYTVGHDIVFAGGEFAPATHEGRRLIAHELAHVLQQSRAGPRLTLQRAPDDEESCALGETLLVYEGKPGQERCITENDPEFRQNYIDNNIVLATGLAIPDTTWENIDQNRFPQIRLTYKDGRTLVVDVSDVPLQLKVVPRRSGAVSVLRPLARYEKRADGFIYPIRMAGPSAYVAYADANNIVSLRAGLWESVEQMQALFQLIELGAVFAGPISALGGIAAMNHSFASGGLFEPVPRKQKTQPTTPTIDEPTPSKGVRPTKREPKQAALKQAPEAPERAPSGSKANTLAESPTEGGHSVRIGKGGLVEVCTDCVNISLVYRETLKDNPELAKNFRDIQTKARQAEEMIASGEPKLVAKGEAHAKAAASEAVRLQNNLAKTGVLKGGTRYRPEPDLLGEGAHGVGWKDSDAVARAKRTGDPQGKFGGLEDVQYAAEQAAQIGAGNETPAPYIPLPANTRSVVFHPNGTQTKATRLYIKVRQNGSFHAYPR